MSRINYNCKTYNFLGKKNHAPKSVPVHLRKRWRILHGFSKEDPRCAENKRRVIRFLLKETSVSKKLEILNLIYYYNYNMSFYTTFYEEYSALKELVIRDKYTMQDLIKAIRYNIVNGPVMDEDVSSILLEHRYESLRQLLEETKDV